MYKIMFTTVATRVSGSVAISTRDISFSSQNDADIAYDHLEKYSQIRDNDAEVRVSAVKLYGPL